MNSKIFKWAGLKKETGYGGNTQFLVGYEHDIMH